MSAIRFQLNGRAVTVDTRPDRSLLSVLRTELGLTGTKYGCGESLCGACTVVVNGQAVRSCEMRVGEVAQAKVVTVEGLEREGRLHPLQQAFIDHGALQCGYCTPGMLMRAYALLQREPHPTRQAILAGMESNLCRCGAHQRIVAAIEDASRKGGAA